MVDDDIQDLVPDPQEGDVGDGDTFSDLNEPSTPNPDEDHGAEPRSARRNDPAKRIGTLTKRVHERDAIIAERDAQLARERQQREAAEARLAELESSRSQQSEAELQAKLDGLKTRRREAFESGDLDTYEDLGDQAAELRAELRELKRAPKREPDPPRREGNQPPPQQPQYPPAATAWAARNQQWYDGQNQQSIKAQQIAQQIITEGKLKPADDDFWDELDERLQAPAQTRGATSGGTVGKDQPSNRGSGLTKEDLAKMKKWGYDPNKPEDRKKWLNRDQELI